MPGMVMSDYFCIAEHCFCVRVVHGTVGITDLLPQYLPFRISKPDEMLLFTLTFQRNELQEEVGLKWNEIGRYDSGDVTHQVYRAENGAYRILFQTSDGEFLGTLFADREFAHCTAVPSVEAHCQAQGVDNILMVVFAFAGAYHDLLLLHASVASIGDKAFLFQGKSGTGKSTHCRLWLECFSDAELLNDDNPVVRVANDGQIYVYGTPWSGKTPCYRNERRHVGGFLRLHQASQNSIRHYTPLEAFASVLSSCSTMIWDRESYEAIGNTVERVVSSVPSYDLECLPNRAAAELSYRTLWIENGI